MLIEVVLFKGNMAKPVLVTGFELLGNHSVNISGEIARELDGHEIRAITFNRMFCQLIMRVQCSLLNC